MQPPVEALEERLSFQFTDRSLLVRALTHRSWGSEHTLAALERSDNEQLEFLGDSILGFVVSEYLFRNHPSADEGALSQWKSHLVSSVHLHRCALQLRIGEHLVLGRGEERNGGRERRTLLANAMEAVIAAVYLDGGFDSACQLIKNHILKVVEDAAGVEAVAQQNFKNALQERSQAMGLPTPRYITVETNGPEHAKIFTVEARIDERLASRASGSSKKSASQLAAQVLLGKLSIPATGNLDPNYHAQ